MRPAGVKTLWHRGETELALHGEDRVSLARVGRVRIGVELERHGESMYALTMATVGEAVRDARQKAGLAQRELADRAGVPLSTVGRIERDAVHPRVDTLQQIADALGGRLNISIVVPRPDTLALIERYGYAIRHVCAAHGARNVEIFGSVAEGTDDASSDLDLLVDLDTDRDLLDLVSLEQTLSEMIGRDVDVIPRSTLNDEFRVGTTLALA